MITAQSIEMKHNNHRFNAHIGWFTPRKVPSTMFQTSRLHKVKMKQTHFSPYVRSLQHPNEHISIRNTSKHEMLKRALFPKHPHMSKQTLMLHHRWTQMPLCRLVNVSALPLLVNLFHLFQLFALNTCAYKTNTTAPDTQCTKHKTNANYW